MLLRISILKIIQTINCHLIFSFRNMFIRMSVPMYPDTWIMKPCWKDFLRKPLSNSISGLSQILSITIICSLPETETPMTIGILWLQWPVKTMMWQHARFMKTSSTLFWHPLPMLPATFISTLQMIRFWRSEEPLPWPMGWMLTLPLTILSQRLLFSYRY